MAARIHVDEPRSSLCFRSALSSAALEWLLMVLLFLDALFSYLVTKFARISKLQTPCILCSRLDHILGNEKPGFYKGLICKAHKWEISSLAYCHIHQKLADVHEMCESCLLSFATENKSNSETYRSLLGILSVDLDDNESPVDVDGEDVVKVPLLAKDVSGSPSMRHCSCCSKSFKNKAHVSRLLQNKSIGAEIADAGIFLASMTGQGHLHLQDGVGKARDESLVDHGFDRLAHIGYSELKITSDSESEVLFSDDDGNALLHATVDLKEDVARSLEPEPVILSPSSSPTTILIDIAPEKLIHPDSAMVETSLLASEKSHHLEESHDSLNLADTVAIGHGLEKINWNQDEVKAHSFNPPASSDIISQQVPSEVSNAKLNASESGDVACISATTSGEMPKALGSAEIKLKPGQIMTDPTPSLQVSLDMNDAYKLAVGGKGSLTSPTITEAVTGRDSSRVHEDLKLLLSQISSARAFEFSWTDVTPSPRVQGQLDVTPSPRVQGQLDEFRFSDASSSVLQNITKRLSIERNESGIESLDGSIVSEIEGENPIDRLKRQIELDRKSISILYKELEEERNASAIAANQAMAMITRLQEEKAAMQMEALQYQRMMEEQAEYDQEALQKLNELLTEREKEIQALEAELESYRKQHGGESLSDRALEHSGDSKAEKDKPISTDLGKSRGYKSLKENELLPQELEWTGSDLLKDPSLGFEDEKCYISERLKRLEKKLHLFSNNGLYVDLLRSDAEEHVPPHMDVSGINYQHGHASLEGSATSNGRYPEETAGISDLEAPCLNDDSSLSREDSHAKTSSILSTQDVEDNHKESLLSLNSDDNRQNSSIVGEERGLTALKNEISDLNERLETLEADRNFLEHAINSLRNGNDGIRFIQEIACCLGELRRIGISRREHTVV